MHNSRYFSQKNVSPSSHKNKEKGQTLNAWKLNIIFNLTCLYSTFQLKYSNISYLVTQPLSLLTTDSVNFSNT